MHIVDTKVRDESTQTKIIADLVRGREDCGLQPKPCTFVAVWRVGEDNETTIVRLHKSSLYSIRAQRHCSAFVDGN